MVQQASHPKLWSFALSATPNLGRMSMAGVSTAVTMWFLRFVLFPLPTLRSFVDYIDVLRDSWIHLYGEREPVTTQTYHRHIEWLKRTVPEDRLVFFNVKDGWAPLFKALGKDEPQIPFPRINDGEAIDHFAKKNVQRGLLRWLEIMVGVGVIAIAGFAATPLRRG